MVLLLSSLLLSLSYWDKSVPPRFENQSIPCVPQRASSGGVCTKWCAMHVCNNRGVVLDAWWDRDIPVVVVVVVVVVVLFFLDPY